MLSLWLVIPGWYIGSWCSIARGHSVHFMAKKTNPTSTGYVLDIQGFLFFRWITWLYVTLKFFCCLAIAPLLVKARGVKPDRKSPSITTGSPHGYVHWSLCQCGHAHECGRFSRWGSWMKCHSCMHSLPIVHSPLWDLACRSHLFFSLSLFYSFLLFYQNITKTGG